MTVYPTVYRWILLDRQILQISRLLPLIKKLLHGSLAPAYFKKENAKQAAAKYDSLSTFKDALYVALPGTDKNA